MLGCGYFTCFIYDENCRGGDVAWRLGTMVPWILKVLLDKKKIYLCTSHSKHKSYSKVKKFKNPKNNLFYIGQNLIDKMENLSL